MRDAVEYPATEAKSFAEIAHTGQFRRDGITPYFHHLEQVAMRCQGESKEVIDAAWLHDVLEDTATTVNQLLEAGFSAATVDAVVLLTRSTDVPANQYYAAIKANPIAKRVKIADMLSNLADGPTEKQMIKYAHGLLALLEP